MSNEAKNWRDEEDDVPADGEAVMGSAVSGLRDSIESEVREFVGGQDFVRALESGVSAVHSELMRILDREQGEVFTKAGTAVLVELDPTAAVIKSELIESGVQT